MKFLKMAFGGRLKSSGSLLNKEPKVGRYINPAIKNPKSSATGLIQLMDSTAKNVGAPTSEWSLGDV
jgi:hypothetical protein